MRMVEPGAAAMRSRKMPATVCFPSMSQFGPYNTYVMRATLTPTR